MTGSAILVSRGTDSIQAALAGKVGRSLAEQSMAEITTIDDGWICTIEREDIYEQVGRVVDAGGFDCQEAWLDERDW
jgi:hypothetical protein